MKQDAKLVRVPNVSERFFRSFVRFNGDEVSVELARIAEALLLYDTVVIESAKLVELLPLIELFGFAGMRKLVGTGALTIYCDAIGIGESGRDQGLVGEALPPGAYRLIAFRTTNISEWIGKWLAPVLSAKGLYGKEPRKLHSLVKMKVRSAPSGLYDHSVEAANAEVCASSPLVRLALAQEIQVRTDQSVEIDDVEFEAQLQSGVLVTRAPTLDRLGIRGELAHEIVKRAILAVARINSSFEEMDLHKGLTLFPQRDVPLFESRIGSALDRDEQASRPVQFRRLLEVSGLPSIDAAVTDGTLRGSALLRVRESDECVAFRRWLATASELPAGELEALTSGFGAQATQFLNSPLGRVVRVLAFAGLGAVDPTAGVASGLVDTFIVNRLLRRGSALTFLDDHYRSIFRD
jgi:hypothetical protein